MQRSNTRSALSTQTKFENEHMEIRSFFISKIKDLMSMIDLMSYQTFYRTSSDPNLLNYKHK